MDAVTEAIAALGNAHRDAVSDPAAMGRLTDDENFARRDEQRRNRAHHQASANKGDERSAKISAWNKQETFGGDSMVEGLANHFSGQGHREDLMLSMGHTPRLSLSNSNTSQSHFANGGRRAQGNGNQAPFAAASLSNSTQGSRPGGLSLPAGLARPVPTSVVGNVKKKAHVKAEARTAIDTPAERTPAAARPSQVAPPPGPAGTPIRIARTAATSGSIPSVRIAAQKSTTVRNLATTASPIHSIMRISSPASGIRTSAITTATVVRIPHTAATEVSTAVRAPATAQAGDYYRKIAHINMAQYYAANPGPLSDKYHERFPERRPYLAKALEELTQKKLIEKEDPAEEVVDDGIGVEAEEATDEDGQKVVEVKENKFVEETTKSEKDSENIEEEAVEKAAGDQKKTAPHTTKKEFPEEASKATVTQVPVERQSHKPDHQDSTSSAGSSLHSIVTADSESSGFSIPTPAAPTSPEKPMYGKLVVTYLDHKSGHLFTHNMNVNAPVRANIQLTSVSPEYDPRKLEVALSALAKTMCMKNPNVLLTRDNDGLWQEVVEDDGDL